MHVLGPASFPHLLLVNCRPSIRCEGMEKLISLGGGGGGVVSLHGGLVVNFRFDSSLCLPFLEEVVACIESSSNISPTLVMSFSQPNLVNPHVGFVCLSHIR
jgi:hypothetical protein